MKRIIIYITALFVFSYLGQIYILINGGIKSETFNLIAPIIMFLPAILVFAFLLISGKGFKSINWGLGRPIFLLYAALIPSLFAFVAINLISFFNWGEIVHFKLSGAQMDIVKGRFVLGQGLQSIPFFILNYLLTTVTFSLISGVLAFGEELGWRGFLQKELISQKGVSHGIIILGLVWGFWHFPLVVSGYNYPDTPILGAFLLFPLTTVFASFFLAWLTLKANSFWPAVIAHGSVNAFIGSFVSGMDYQNRLAADVLIVLIWAIIAAFSYRSIKRMHIH